MPRGLRCFMYVSACDPFPRVRWMPSSFIAVQRQVFQDHPASHWQSWVGWLQSLHAFHHKNIVLFIKLKDEKKKWALDKKKERIFFLVKHIFTQNPIHLSRPNSNTCFSLLFLFSESLARSLLYLLILSKYFLNLAKSLVYHIHGMVLNTIESLLETQTAHTHFFSLMVIMLTDQMSRRGLCLEFRLTKSPGLLVMSLHILIYCL